MTAAQVIRTVVLVLVSAFAAHSATAEEALSTLRQSATVADIFEADHTNQFVIDIEAALARAQAAHGVIPQSAADEITRKANIRFAPTVAVKAERKIVQHRMVALLNVWRRALDEEAGQFLHYGATTVDIYDTVLTLQLRRSVVLIIGHMRDLESIMIKLADTHRDAVMAGRTLGQHAMPITFGKKVATWIGENRRNIERLKVVLVELDHSAILKGAVGTYAGLGERAIEVERTFAKELGLKEPYPDDWHGSRDVYAAYAQALALISRSYGRIGQELFLLQMTDLGETSEPRDEASVSSSSMAQKVNPSKSEALIQGGRTIPRLAEVALDDVVNFFERDNTSGPNATLEEISIKSEQNLKVAKELLASIEVNRDAMRRNIDRSEGFMLAQRVVFALSAKLGKETAEEKVRAVIHKALDDGSDFRTALTADAEISGILKPTDLDTLLKPEGYTGLANEEVDAVIAHAKRLAGTDPVE
ncbi:MAG: lyase family protein [Hyphomicrobium sp.]|uniref:lyase family protein n=1 Tax=Hyphomicrobium sp. TaxID=82 RepID=UPI003D0F86F2